MLKTIDKLATEMYTCVKNKEPYQCHTSSIIILGDNSAGKTSLLDKFFDLVKRDKSKEFYYIDAKNRVLTAGQQTQVFSMGYDFFDPYKILEERTQKIYRSQHDVFPDNYSGGLITYNELLNNIELYSKMAMRYIGKSLSMPDDEIKDIPKDEEMPEEEVLNQVIGADGNSDKFKKILVDGIFELNSLSSSEAAMLRIAMEVEFAKTKDCTCVVIDEFDSHMESENMIDYMNKLVLDYPSIRFIFVTHQMMDLIKYTGSDALLMCVEGKKETYCSKIDCDDIQKVAQVHRIRDKVVGNRRNEERILDMCISYFIKFGELSVQLVSEYEKVKESELTPKEKILLSYLQRMMLNADKDTNSL